MSPPPPSSLMDVRHDRHTACVVPVFRYTSNMLHTTDGQIREDCCHLSGREQGEGPECVQHLAKNRIPLISKSGNPDAQTFGWTDHSQSTQGCITGASVKTALNHKNLTRKPRVAPKLQISRITRWNEKSAFPNCITKTDEEDKGSPSSVQNTRSIGEDLSPSNQFSVPEPVDLKCSHVPFSSLNCSTCKEPTKTETQHQVPLYSTMAERFRTNKLRSSSAPLRLKPSGRSITERLSPALGDVCEGPSSKLHIPGGLDPEPNCRSRIDDMKSGRSHNIYSRITVSDRILRFPEEPYLSKVSLSESGTQKNSTVAYKQQFHTVKKGTVPQWLGEDKGSSTIQKGDSFMDALLVESGLPGTQTKSRRPSLLRKALLTKTTKQVPFANLSTTGFTKLSIIHPIRSSMVLDTNIDLDKLIRDSGAINLLVSTTVNPHHSKYFHDLQK